MLTQFLVLSQLCTTDVPLQTAVAWAPCVWCWRGGETASRQVKVKDPASGTRVICWFWVWCSCVLLTGSHSGRAEGERSDWGGSVRTLVCRSSLRQPSVESDRWRPDPHRKPHRCGVWRQDKNGEGVLIRSNTALRSSHRLLCSSLACRSTGSGMGLLYFLTSVGGSV